MCLRYRSSLYIFFFIVKLFVVVASFFKVKNRYRDVINIIFRVFSVYVWFQMFFYAHMLPVKIMLVFQSIFFVIFTDVFSMHISPKKHSSVKILESRYPGC